MEEITLNYNEPYIGYSTEPGKLFTKSGVKLYEGEWINGKVHGIGTCFYLDGTKSYVG